jgi:glucan biosynthesis protein C
MSNNNRSKGTAPKNRLHYLDWIRVMAILSVFFYHSDRFFDYRSYPIQNFTRSIISTIHREFFQIWLMPFFFIISGAAVLYSLQSQSTGAFIKKRTLRILVPFVFVGLFIISPPQIYLERLMNGQFSGSFFQWFPNYFNGIYLFSPNGNFPFFGMHLWYLEYLFLYSLVLLPLFINYGTKKTSVLARLSIWFNHPVSLFLLCVPLAIIAVWTELNGFAPFRMAGGWDQLSYFLFFALGYMIFSNLQIQDTVKTYSIVFLILSILLTLPYLIIGFGSNSPEVSIIARHNLIQGETPTQIPIAWLGVLALRSVLAWCWSISFLGLGARFLNRNTRYIEYANEAVLPFYILHQTILLVIGYFVIHWRFNILTKYSIITIASFIVIMVVYEFFVRRIDVLRFLFGMKPKNIRRIRVQTKFPTNTYT